MTSHTMKEKTNTAARLVKNSAWLFFSEILSKLTALGTQIIAARYLGDEGFGVFGFAFIATGIVLDFIDNGLKVFLTRAISREPELMGDYLRNIFALKWILTFFSVLVFSAGLILIPLDSETLKVVSIVGIALVINGYAEMYLGVFRAFEKMLLVSKLMVFQRALFFVLGLLVLLTGSHVMEFSEAFLLTSIICFFVTRKQMSKPAQGLRRKFDWVLIWKILKDSMPICGVVFFSYIYFCIDSVLLFLMVGKAGTGWYFAAFKIIESLALLLASVRGALFPILSRICSHDGGRFERLWKEAARYLLIVGLPISAGTAVLSPQLIDILYGADYEITGLVLQVMAIPFFLLVINEFIAYLLLSADKTSKVLKIVRTGALINIVLNILIIPQWGLIGAAISAGLTELLLFVLFFRAINKYYEETSFLSLVWRPALAAVGMAWVIVQMSWAIIPSVLLGISVYFLILILLQTFNEYDFLVLRCVFNRTSDENLVAKLPEVSLPLSIVIVSYKSLQHITECLNSIQANLGQSEYEIIVVDNASGDGTVESLRQSFPKVHLIANDQNLGFSKANNQAIKISRGEYILLLNNDTEVLQGSLENMMNIMAKSPQIGLLGCRLLNPDQSLQESFGDKAGFVQEFFRKFLWNKIYKSNSKFKFLLNWTHSEEKEVGWVRGACMLFQRNAIADVGLMDENYFMYFEDMDIGLSLRKRGWEVRFTPEASIIHHQGVSQSKAPHLKAMAYRKSQLYYYKKNYGQVGLRGLKAYPFLKVLSNAVVSFVYRRNESEEVVRFRREERELIRTYQ